MLTSVVMQSLLLATSSSRLGNGERCFILLHGHDVLDRRVEEHSDGGGVHGVPVVDLGDVGGVGDDGMLGFRKVVQFDFCLLCAVWDQFTFFVEDVGMVYPDSGGSSSKA